MKKVIIILTAILIFLIIITILISNFLKGTNQKTSKKESITSVPYNSSSNTINATNNTNNSTDTTKNSQTSSRNNKSNAANLSKSSISTNSTGPSTSSTNLTDSPNNEISSPQGGDLVSEEELLKNKKNTTNLAITGTASQEKNPSLELYQYAIGIFLTPQPTAIPGLKQELVTKDNVSSKTYNGLVYYSQCNASYSSIIMSGNTSICRAGCGPTSVAMLLSSFIDDKYTPPYVVDLYKENGQFVGGGTWLSSAQLILNKYGLTTTDPISFGYGNASQVASDFKKYLDEGWLLFVLAYYKQEDGKYKGGHYFIVSGIEDGQIMAFDPYYGSGKALPFNENTYDPFPVYLYGLGVKK